MEATGTTRPRPKRTKKPEWEPIDRDVEFIALANYHRYILATHVIKLYSDKPRQSRLSSRLNRLADNKYLGTRKRRYGSTELVYFLKSKGAKELVRRGTHERDIRRGGAAHVRATSDATTSNEG